MKTFGEDIEKWKEIFEVVNSNPALKSMEERLLKAYKNRDIFPEYKNIFRAFRECSLTDLKVIWIGQDPYHDGKATGLSMGVEGDRIPPTLRILSLCCQHEFGKPITDFSLLSWAQQGVLLLNAALTVEKKKPGSHAKFWAPYMANLLQDIADAKQDVIWVLLGKNAQELVEPIEGIKEDNIVKGPHPMVAQYSGDLDGYTHRNLFTEINHKLTNAGHDKIRFTAD